MPQPWYETGESIRRKFKIDCCECCGRELSGAVRMLELDHRTDSYHDFGDVPEAKSQGWFPFGLRCAKKQIAITEGRRKIIATTQQ